jgi:hypothetical protein
MYVIYIQIRLLTFKIKITLEIVVIKFHIFRSIIGLPCSFFIEAKLLSVLYNICKYVLYIINTFWVWANKTTLTSPLVIEMFYQARNVSGHVTVKPNEHHLI